MKILKGITQNGMAHVVATIAAEHGRNERALHVSLTPEVIEDAARRTMFDLSMIGFCIDCGAEHDCCEPDAERYHCNTCGANQVYGAEQLLLMTVA